MGNHRADSARPRPWRRRRPRTRPGSAAAGQAQGDPSRPSVLAAVRCPARSSRSAPVASLGVGRRSPSPAGGALDGRRHAEHRARLGQPTRRATASALTAQQRLARRPARRPTAARQPRLQPATRSRDAADARLAGGGREPGASSATPRSPSSPRRPRSRPPRSRRTSGCCRSVGYHLTARFGDCQRAVVAASTPASTSRPRTGTPIHGGRQRHHHRDRLRRRLRQQTVETLDDGTELWYCHQTRSASPSATRSARGAGHRLRRLHRQRHRPPPAPRGPPRRRRPGRPLHRARRPRPPSLTESRRAGSLRASRPARSAAAAA